MLEEDWKFTPLGLHSHLVQMLDFSVTDGESLEYSWKAMKFIIFQ